MSGGPDYRRSKTFSARSVVYAASLVATHSVLPALWRWNPAIVEAYFPEDVRLLAGRMDATTIRDAEIAPLVP